MSSTSAFCRNGIGSYLQAVSEDGSVGVGAAGDEQGDTRAAIWTPANGVQDLREVLVGLGLETEFEGWYLSAANTISSDGRVIAGVGIDAQERPRAGVRRHAAVTLDASAPSPAAVQGRRALRRCGGILHRRSRSPLTEKRDDVRRRITRLPSL